MNASGMNHVCNVEIEAQICKLDSARYHADCAIKISCKITCRLQAYTIELAAEIWGDFPANLQN